MADIFISYAREDRSRVKPLAKSLESLGWTVWWDPKVRAGKHFDRVIEKALKEARSVLVVWSANSVDSDWVRAEAAYGLEQDFLISISIDENIKPPIRFYHIHTEPLIDWDPKKPSIAFDKIVADLEAILGKAKPIEKTKPEQVPKPGNMVKIPKGLFLYGEEKRRKAINYDYAIDVFPVTNERYKEFLYEDQGQRVPYVAEEWAKPYNWDETNRTYPEGRSSHPVVLVSHVDAQAYCKWRSQKEGKEYRLPLEAEWEKAARGNDGREYPWGNDFDIEKCNTEESKIVGTTEVTRYPAGASPYGCYDMAGNVWNWTRSIYDKKEKTIALRGGSYLSTRDIARCAYRYSDEPNDRRLTIGFRCVRTLK